MVGETTRPLLAAVARAAGARVGLPRAGSCPSSEHDDVIGPAISLLPITLVIDLDKLTPAERRDLGNALLRAASSAALEETRIALLDLVVAIDNAPLGDAA